MKSQTSRQPGRIGQLIHGSNAQLKEVKVLIVGVGGIGCEILKVLVKMEIGEVHILDMDTIQISNLNRQFLFKRQHKGMSKALVARESILALNGNSKIHAYHTNIKELKISFFRQFDFIIMALDNIDARNYVNRIGVRLSIPIIDAGTLAYKGNVTTIISRESRCYSCEPKESNQKVYPVCTIRSRPQKPIHCIVWAKMLFEVMFGGNTDNDMNDLAVLAEKEEADILNQLFVKDIQVIKESKEDSQQNKLTEAYLKKIRILPQQTLKNGLTDKAIEGFNGFDTVQSLEKSVTIFVEAFKRLKAEKPKLGTVVFEKDDDDVIHFISSAANLRMHCFSIQEKTFNEVKNMAGNIVPAIASTNSIVSGIEILQMLKYLRKKKDRLRSYFIQNQHTKILATKLEKVNEKCHICSQKAFPTIIDCHFDKTKLKDVITVIQQKSKNLPQFSVNQGSKELYLSDEPNEKLLSKNLSELTEAYEFDLILTNQENTTNVCTIWLIHNENATVVTVYHEEKLTPKPVEQQMEAEPLQTNGAVQDNDSDLVMCGEDEASPELEIIEVHKREKLPGQGVQQYDIIQKKNKSE